MASLLACRSLQSQCGTLLLSVSLSVPVFLCVYMCVCVCISSHAAIMPFCARMALGIGLIMTTEHSILARVAMRILLLVVMYCSFKAVCCMLMLSSCFYHIMPNDNSALLSLDHFILSLVWLILRYTRKYAVELPISHWFHACA